MCGRWLIKQRTCLVIKMLREASHADVPLGIRSVFKETHTFQPCVEEKVEVVDFIPCFFITHSHTRYKGGRGALWTWWTWWNCSGKAGGAPLSLSLSASSPLHDRFVGGNLFCPPGELTPSLRNYSQPWQKAGDVCAKRRVGARAGRLKLPLPLARHHKGGGEIALIFPAI